MTRRVFLFLAMVMVAVAARAQDPVKTLPQNYWLEFENAWVKVIHVRYPPHVKLEAHDHPPTPTLFVYLSDSGPVKLDHAGKDTFDLVRPPLKTGQMRISPGRLETHTVENLGDVQSDFLRVELKSLPLGLKDFEKRVPAADAAFWAGPTRVEFDGAKMRVTRMGVAAGQKALLTGDPQIKRALWIVIRGNGAAVAGKALHAGECWDSATLSVAAGSENVELVRVDLK